MKPHEERVVLEQTELEEKLIKLREFISSNSIYPKLSLDEQARLKTQEFHMSMYWRVLGDRINEFSK